MKYLICFLVASILLCNQKTHAQSWQWAKRGGGVLPYNTSGGFSDDNVLDMATDLRGNVYILSYVGCTGGSNIDIDGNIKKGNDGTDVAISSFRCDGTFRWMKILGDKSNCYGLQLKTDTIGGVYISLFYSRRSPSLRKIDTDTTLETTDQTMMLLKYDSAGVYKWLRLPEIDTVSFFANAGRGRIFDMDVKGNGEISLLTGLTGGVYASGAYTVPDTAKLSVHMLKYNAAGGFIKGFAMDIDGDGGGVSKLKMKWDTKRDKYIIYGTIYRGSNIPLWDTLSLGTTTLSNSLFASEFDNNGSLKWLKQNTSNYGGLIDAAIDRFCNIYFLGGVFPGDTFNSFTCKNLFDTDGVSFITKMDSSTNHIWTVNSSNVNANYPRSIDIVSDTLMTAIGYVGKWGWGPITLAGAGQCIIRINAKTSAVMKYDTLASNGEITKLVSDRFGNFYGGGTFSSSTYGLGTNTLTKAGGATDFFITQYGFGNCTTPIVDKPISIVESLVISNVKIYPNPANDFITIEGLQSGSEVRLFSIIGQQVLSHKVQSNIDQIAIGSLTSGMYLVQIRTNDGAVYSSKIVKE